MASGASSRIANRYDGILVILSFDEVRLLRLAAGQRTTRRAQVGAVSRAVAGHP